MELKFNKNIVEEQSINFSDIVSISLSSNSDRVMQKFFYVATLKDGNQVKLSDSETVDELKLATYYDYLKTCLIDKNPDWKNTFVVFKDYHLLINLNHVKSVHVEELNKKQILVVYSGDRSLLKPFKHKDKALYETIKNYLPRKTQITK